MLPPISIQIGVCALSTSSNPDSSYKTKRAEKAVWDVLSDRSTWCERIIQPMVTNYCGPAIIHAPLVEMQPI